MKKLAIFILVIGITAPTMGQDIILHQDVNQIDEDRDFGPNRIYFTHMLASIGWNVATNSKELKSHILGSYNFEFGFRYKVKVSELYALGIDLEYVWNRFYLDQRDSRGVIDDLEHRKEVLSNNGIHIGLFNRFNFDKRGNILGKYLQLGVFAEYYFTEEHYYNNKVEPSNDPGGELVEITISDLNFVNPLNYGLKAMLGINKVNIYAKYRMSEFIQSNDLDFDMAKFSVGIELAIY